VCELLQGLLRMESACAHTRISRRWKDREERLERGGRRNATQKVVFSIVSWFLDRISANDGRISVIVVRFIGSKINFSEKLLFVML
jgi:hypothetical protein